MSTTDIELRLRNLASDDDRKRHVQGLDVLQRIGGTNFGGPVNALADFSEDLARFTIQYPYGDVLSRPALDLRCRQILTVAMLLAHGSAQAQLAFHLTGLLNVGGTRDDAVDLLYLAAGLLGFPAAINAVPIVRDVMTEFTATDRGEEPVLRPGVPANSHARLEMLKEIAPEFVDWRDDVLGDEILAAIRMEPRIAHMAAGAMLGAGGRSGDSFDQHIVAALETGATQAEIVEMIIQLSVYSGFPAALNAAGRARKVLESAQTRAPKTRTGGHRRPIDDKRFKRGTEVLEATSGGSGAAVVESFRDVDADLGSLIVAHCYGDIFYRDGLQPKVRELTACAALAAQGTVAAEKPLAVHIDAALNLGASRQEIIETLFNVIPYAGYPLVEKALLIARERLSVFDARRTGQPR